MEKKLIALREQHRWKDVKHLSTNEYTCSEFTGVLKDAVVLFSCDPASSFVFRKTQ